MIAYRRRNRPAFNRHVLWKSSSSLYSSTPSETKVHELKQNPSAGRGSVSKPVSRGLELNLDGERSSVPSLGVLCQRIAGLTAGRNESCWTGAPVGRCAAGRFEIYQGESFQQSMESR